MSRRAGASPRSVRSGRVARGRATRDLVTAAASGYAANVAFGTAVASGLVDNRRIRWVHHALYIVTAALTGAALVSAVAQRRPAGLALAPAVVPLALLPGVGRGRRHVTAAAAAAPSFVIALCLSWRRSSWNS